MSTLIVNELDAHAIARSRMALVSGSLDLKRPGAYEVFGWPQEVTFERLLQAYERGGAGSGAVHRLLDKCWERPPRIKQATAGEEVTDWERKLQKVLAGCQAWAKLRDLDRRNMVGRYAAAILRVADGKKTFEPLQAGASRLVDVIPVYESQIRVEKWDTDENSETYGQPLMFGIETAPPTERDTQARPRAWLKVHPSRVLLLAEGAVGDNFQEGVPLLRAGFNELVNLEKISGGSAESYLKNSSRTLVFKYDKDVSLDNVVDQDGKQVDMRALHQQRTRDLNHNIDSAAVVKGGDVSTLQTSVADPTKPFEVAACMFAASVRIPFTILFGQQTGRLASDEDRADFNARCKSRQTNELTPMLEQLVKRLQACGLVDAGEFTVEWPDLAAPSDLQKLEHAEKMANVNKAASGTGGVEAPFDSNELRQAAGYKARKDVDVGEGGEPGGEGA